MQEKILQNQVTGIRQQSDTENGRITALGNEPLQQLTIEMPTPGGTMIENTYATVTNHVFPYYIPQYPTDQTHVDMKNQQSLYPPTLTMTRTESTADCNSLSPKMYIMDEAKPASSGSDEESDRSQNDGETPIWKNRKMSESSDDSNCISKVTQNVRSEDSSDKPKSKNKSSKKALRTNYTPGQVQALERVFHEIPYPDAAKIESLAKDLDIAEAKLKIWFQNKRARMRRRAQEKPQQNFMQPIAPGMLPISPGLSQMGPYGVIPPYHPMLHGSPAGISQRPFFYQGYQYGMSPPSSLSNPSLQRQLRTPEHHFMMSGQQTTPTSPLANGSTSSSSSPTSSTTASPKSSESGSPPSIQTMQPYHHGLSHIQPYIPFSYQYNMCPPYYC